MPTCTIRLPDTWKNDLVTLRDTLPETLGQELIAALASRTPEQIEAMVRTMQAGGTPAAVEGNPAAGAGSNAELASPEPELDRLLNRPVPYGLVGLFSRVLDAAMDDPARVREALTKTCQWLF
jgi:hypothetical protein